MAPSSTHAGLAPGYSLVDEADWGEYSGEAWSREALRRKLTAFPFESERSR